MFRQLLKLIIFTIPSIIIFFIFKKFLKGKSYTFLFITLAISLLIAFFFAKNVFAQDIILLNEPFTYSNGNLAGNGLWSHYSGTAYMSIVSNEVKKSTSSNSSSQEYYPFDTLPNFETDNFDWVVEIDANYPTSSANLQIHMWTTKSNYPNDIIDLAINESVNSYIKEHEENHLKIFCNQENPRKVEMWVYNASYPAGIKTTYPEGSDIACQTHPIKGIHLKKGSTSNSSTAWSFDNLDVYYNIPYIDPESIGDITGNEFVGETLTMGEVLPSNANYTIQWLNRCGSDIFYSDIAGATSSTYVLQNSDTDCFVKVEVSNIGGNIILGSSATGRIANYTYFDLPVYDPDSVSSIIYTINDVYTFNDFGSVCPYDQYDLDIDFSNYFEQWIFDWSYFELYYIDSITNNLIGTYTSTDLTNNVLSITDLFYDDSVMGYEIKFYDINDLLLKQEIFNFILNNCSFSFAEQGVFSGNMFSEPIILSLSTLDTRFPFGFATVLARQTIQWLFNSNFQYTDYSNLLQGSFKFNLDNTDVIVPFDIQTVLDDEQIVDNTTKQTIRNSTLFVLVIVFAWSAIGYLVLLLKRFI